MTKLVYGISANFHDAALTVTQGDEILFASHSERFSKKKHDKELSESMLSYAIDNFGKPDTIAYYENHTKKKFRQMRTGENYNVFRSNPTKDVLKKFNLQNVPFVSYDHHKSHAAAGFQTSDFDHATVVVIDAIGEFDCITIWDAEYDYHGLSNRYDGDMLGNATYTKIWSASYPHSIGLFYSAFTKHVELEPLDEEYILMGMSAYGDPKYVDEIKHKYIQDAYEIQFKENLHIGVDPSFLDFSHHARKMDIAASVQVITEELICNVMSRAALIGKSHNLVFMGGVALNCLANRLLGNYFENIWVMPNPGDAGSSLGACALNYGKQMSWQGPYLGYNIDRPYPVEELIKELQTNKIVGVANGRAEFGPRALGNRSLLADPRGNDIKDQVNSIKRRQNFRPFAPIILEEHVHQFFDMPKGWNKSDYMQVVAPCKVPNQFPAIVHTDNTSRVQTVPKDCKSGVRKLLEVWYAKTGCPMLLNTSLNVRGFPMVNDLADALAFEQKYNVRVL
jgi:carbamoyltransferase